jgi:hypothetical protein
VANVYVVGDTEPLKEILAVDEKIHLQDLLEANSQLLPGDQINPYPDDPCRWLLIGREMPVPNPSTGSDCWNLDFFFVDQNAVPTFVECKRHEEIKDTGSRRKLIGQLLEYAANGHYYWTADKMRECAERANKKDGLEVAFRELRTDEEDSVDAFFERVQENLRELQIRIVFFLDQAPMELRSVVDFLNKQMERSWVLLVEARRYGVRNGVDIVVPTLFGYTEQARLIKRTVTINTDKKPIQNIDDFIDHASHTQELNVEQVGAMRRLYDECAAHGWPIQWGRGRNPANFLVGLPTKPDKHVIAVSSNGLLSLQLGALGQVSHVKDLLMALFREVVELKIPPDKETRFPSYPAEVWADKVDKIVEVLKKVLSSDRAEGRAGNSQAMLK